MKACHPLAICLMVIGMMLAAGCTGSQNPPASPSAPVAVSPSPLPIQTASFTMGDHYLQKSYSFQGENDVRTEQFRVSNPSWGIQFTVMPLNENLQYCWFEMQVTNMDTGHEDTYGYGRDKGFERKQQYPMYITGPYTVVMKGNRVKVDVDVAQRIP
jgi:hypothetical protein